MFKIATKPTYKRNITVQVPLDMGKTERQSFVMEFKRLSVTETKELVKMAEEQTLDDINVIADNAMDWEGVKDEDGNDVDFSVSTLESLMDIPYVRKAIMNAFLEDVFGKEAIRKN